MKTDDPKLTAYALDELDPAERTEVEALLREDPALVAEIEKVQALAADLRSELRSESSVALTEDERARVFLAARDASTRAVVAVAPPRAYWGAWVLRAAACLALLAAIAGLSLPMFQAPRMASRSQHVDFHTALAKDAAPAGPASHRFGPALAANLADAQKAADYGNVDLYAKNTSDAGKRLLGATVDFTSEMVLEERVNETEYARNTSSPVTRGYTGNERVVQLSTDSAAISAATPAAPVPSENAPALAITTAPAAPVDEHDLLARPAAIELRDAKKPVSTAARPEVTELAKLSEEPVARRASRLRVLADQTASAPKADQPRPDGLSVAGVEAKLEKTKAATPLGSIVQQTADAPAATAAEGLVREQQRGSVPLGYSGFAEVASAVPADNYRFKRSDPSAMRPWFEKEQRDLLQLQRQPTVGNTEAYDSVTDNPFLDVRGNPLSTFSIDVDSASYANVRRFINAGQRPPRGAVRIEELINYFSYDYPQPDAGQAFAAALEVATCPWKPEHRIVRVGIKGREIKRDQRPPSNLVFLIDVSGSMQPENKLPLVKESLRLMVDHLDERDRVAIAVYAGASGCVLEPTHDKSVIRAAIDRLEAGGSTNGASGIQLAYELAQRAFIKEGANRVILATDGDFNVGITSQSALVDLIQEKAKSGVFLTVLGFGMGNLKDSTLEKLADKGNGNYAYIDTINEGRRVLVEQMSGTLVTIAKDVKIQVEFNPAQVNSYRLVGYENRLLSKEDFNDDTKDAGEIGAGHSVTVLYEIVPAGAAPPAPQVDPLKYQQPPRPQLPAIAGRSVDSGATATAELLTLKLRHKQPDGDKSQLVEVPLTDRGITWEKSSRDFRFAAAVASFGMLLRDSPYKGNATWETTHELAVEGKGEDPSGYRAEFISLVSKAKSLTR